MTAEPVTRVVFTDANILINLSHIERLDLLGLLDGFEFIVPEPVAAELLKPAQKTALARAVEEGYVRGEPLTDLGQMTLFAELRLAMGDGEAACLAMAAGSKAIVATSDKKRRFLREARRVLGEGRLLNLTGLFVLAIQRGILTVEDADDAKDVLARHRFEMKISSFRDLLAA